MGFAATETPFRRNGIARFGVFELDLAALKLLRNGREVGLQQQPALLLSELVANAGQLVTREQLKDRIWPSGTYVEFDYGLNTTVNRVRRALRDSASEPRYIETVPKQGYRFIAPVEITRVGVEQAAQPADAEPVPAPPQVPEPRSWRRRRIVMAGSAAALLLVAGAFLTLHFHTKAPVGENGAVVRSYVSLPAGHVPDMVTISPAGDQIVYQASGGGVRRLYRRILGEEESHPIPDSEGGSQPFFSPDGAEVGFYTRTAIRIVGPRGYRDVVAVPAEFTQRKAVWGEDQFLYYTTPREGIWRTPVRGGKAEPVVRPPQEIGAPFYFPQQLLTDPQPRLLYSTNKGPLRRWIEVAQLGGSAQAAGHVVVQRAMGGQVLRSGELVYYWQGALMVAPYDSRAGRLAGSPIEAVVNVASNGWYGGDAGVSNNGTLVYVERRLPERKLVWVDRHGRETVLPIPRAAYEQAEVSPDGTKIAIVRQDRPGHWSLWVYGVRSGEWMRVLDQDVPVPRSVWSPDGKALIAAAAMGEAEFVNLYRISLADPQKPERLTEQSYFGHFPGAWSAPRRTQFCSPRACMTGRRATFLPCGWAGRNPRGRLLPGRALIARLPSRRTGGGLRTRATPRRGRRCSCSVSTSRRRRARYRQTAVPIRHGPPTGGGYSSSIGNTR